MTAGGGTLSAASAQTTGQGQASVTYTLGPAAGQNTVTASANGLAGSPVTFTFMATAIEPGPPSVISAVSGDDQTARVSQSLPQPLVVKVSDTSGIGVPGVTVTWSVTAGGGTLSATSTTTDGAGKTSVTLTLGPNAGTNTVTASVTGLQGSPVSFTATGTLPVLVTIEMLNVAFVAPGGGDAVTILLGDTIQWVNRDAVQHTATSNSQPRAGAAFDSSFLNQGQTFRFVPNVRGTWVYFCQMDPVQMQGATITVQ